MRLATRGKSPPTSITSNCSRGRQNSKPNPIQNPDINPGSRSWLRRAVIGRNPKTTLVRVAVWAVLCVVVFRLALIHVRVDGISMLPTCPDNAHYWVNRLAYLWHEPQRGDVVAIRFVKADGSISRLEPPHVMLLKRVIGLPGETVAFVDGKTLINGQVLDEPYETAAATNGLVCNWNCAPVTLGSNEYYCVGDNRSMPPQDHTKGAFPRSYILGKARL